MPDRDGLNVATLKPGQSYSGFRVERVVPLSAISVTAVELRHVKSGAKMLHLAAADPENLFAVAFRTPPPDDTGLPHILEHSVLCGSKRYPVKDPFVELLKTSLATFLNAFTYPDRTVYPCSSMNPKDFQNLMRVYCDAVFFPVLSEDHFRQEGHHLEFAADGEPSVKGVVYNEMRGVYSDPDGLLDRHIQHLLFDSNAYGRDYGGDPRHIPELTYAQYLAFHRAYYHPANAWIFTYGDADLGKTLEILDNEYLGGFDALNVDSSIQPMEDWTAPRAAVFTYPLDSDGDPAGKTDIAVAFAANDRRDPVATLAMHVIDAYLLDNAASPLRKALIDSRLGEELGSSGYADHQRDTFFVVSLKGSEPDRAEAMEKLCLDVVRAECAKGFAEDKVESALRRLELSAREIPSQYPLRLMERAFASWLYDSDPLAQISIGERLDELRKALAADKGFLERLAMRWLVDNPHRLRITMTPDKDYVEKNDREAETLLRDRLAKMTDADVANAKIVAERLEVMQSEGNSPEALATLPRLAKSDVSPEPLPLAYEVKKTDAGDVIEVPLYSGGISYLYLCLELGELSPDELDLLPLLCSAMEKGGAAGLDYADMAAREAAHTGALEFACGVAPHIDGPGRARLRLGGWLKALDTDWDKALGILADRLFQPDFADANRLRDIVLQSRVAWRNQVVPAGNAYAALYAAKGLSPAMAVAERLGGCTQGRFIDRLAAGLDGKLGELAERLAALRAKVLAGARVTASQVGAAPAMAAARDWLSANAARFGGALAAALPRSPFPERIRIGLAAPADIAYAARAMTAPAITHPDAPALALLGPQLSYGHLWNEVRVKGGAYGVRAAYDGAKGVFTFSSYRDPHIARTLDVFAGVPGFVADGMDLSPSGLEQAIIGSVKSLDQPIRPPSAAVTALNRYLGGETEVFRRRFRSGLLGLTADQVRTAAANVFAGMASSSVCAIASREKIGEENGELGDKPLAVESLWDA